MFCVQLTAGGQGRQPGTQVGGEIGQRHGNIYESNYFGPELGETHGFSLLIRQMWVLGPSQAKQFRVCCEFIPGFLFTLFLLSASFLTQFFQFQLVSRTPAQTNSSSSHKQEHPVDI